MISRYENKYIKSLFSEQNKYRLFTIIELDVIKELYREDIINLNDYLSILDINKYPTVEAVKMLEKETNHETAAYVRALHKLHGKAGKRWLHYGLTSSDLLDTHLGIICNLANKYILEKLEILINIICDMEIKQVGIAARTHGMVAEIIPVSTRFYRFVYELDYIKNILSQNIFYGKISGPVGINNIIPNTVQYNILKKYGLRSTIRSTQITPRSSYALYISELAVLSSILSKFATDIRLLQMDGIGEISEGFSKTQYGSSAMPHKKNPITCEKICGLNRIIRSYSSVALENNELWLERDMSHSSAERIIIEDSFHIISHLLDSMTNVINNIYINYEQIAMNINKFEDKLTSHKRLCTSIKNGDSTREEEYKNIQKGFI